MVQPPEIIRLAAFAAGYILVKQLHAVLPAHRPQNMDVLEGLLLRQHHFARKVIITVENQILRSKFGCRFKIAAILFNTVLQAILVVCEKVEGLHLAVEAVNGSDLHAIECRRLFQQADCRSLQLTGGIEKALAESDAPFSQTMEGLLQIQRKQASGRDSCFHLLRSFIVKSYIMIIPYPAAEENVQKVQFGKILQLYATRQSV